MEEARVGLLRTVERLKEEAQLRWFAATNPNPSSVPVPVKIWHSPSLTYAKGKFTKIRMKNFESIYVDAVDNRGIALTTPIRELVTAQVSKTENSPFSKKTLEMIAAVLQLLTTKKDEKGFDLEELEVGPNRIFYVVFKNGKKVELSEYLKSNPQTVVKRLENIQIFEMEQVFGTEDRQELVAFTVRPSTKTYFGYVQFERNLMTGHYDLHVIEVHTDRKFTLPLTEARIDPWD